MKSETIINCPICNTEYDFAENIECPLCKWEYQGHEDILEEGEKCPYHLISIREAKKRFSEGFTIWGKPLNN